MSKSEKTGVLGLLFTSFVHKQHQYPESQFFHLVISRGTGPG